jgi:hypothetical protein
MSKKVMQQTRKALKKLKPFEDWNYGPRAFKTELTKPEPEPVAWMHPIHTSLIEPHKFDPDCIPLYRKEDV